MSSLSSEDTKPAAAMISNDDSATNDNDNTGDAAPSVTLIAKFGKEKITMDKLSPVTTIGEVKSMITERTGVLAKRQKLIGLSCAASSNSSGGGRKSSTITDDVILSDLKVKPQKSSSSSSAATNSNNNNNTITHQFILMGTPEEKIFVDPHLKDDLPDVVDDFDLDFNAGSKEWNNHVETGMNLTKFTESTAINMMNEPRPGKPLLVLDLDHTLLDFSSKTLLNNGNGIGNGTAGSANNTTTVDEHVSKMKRPYMDEFLTRVYQHYDLVVWSQTSWRWLETKLVELNMIGFTVQYKFCFVLDKTSMFRIVSTNKKNGQEYKHAVKPLQIIWTKFPNRWNSHNTVHLDDLSRNFALNLTSGLKVTPYYRKKTSSGGRGRDVELLGLGQYLEQLATSGLDFGNVNFDYWQDVISNKRTLLSTLDTNDNNGNDNEGKKKADKR